MGKLVAGYALRVGWLKSQISSTKSQTISKFQVQMFQTRFNRGFWLTGSLLFTDEYSSPILEGVAHLVRKLPFDFTQDEG